MRKKLLYTAFAGFSLIVGLQAAEVAFWDFEEAIDGQYGVESITQSVDSVSGLIAVEGSGNPLYVRGADGVGHGTGAGILKVSGDDSLLTGFTQFKISFDARLHAAPSATQALLRYGVTKTAWNIYTTTDSSIRMELYDVSGTRYTLSSGSSAMPAGDGNYHHYELVWNGFELMIIVDDVVKSSMALEISAVRSTDGNGYLGIGGMVRENGTTGQEFDGFIDNLQIEGDWTPMNPVASWNFEEGTVGNDIVHSVDSVTGLVASVNGASPQYVAGNGGGAAAGFGGISGVLEVQDSEGLLGHNFSKLAVTFDVDLTASNTATTVLLRNGHLTVPFNIFVSSSSEIGVALMDDDGATTSGNVYTSGASPALDPDAGWQSVSVVWDGTAIYISVDGEVLGYKETTAVDLLAASDAPMGIGGLVRSTGSTGQYLPGSIDNIEIKGLFVAPALTEISDVTVEVDGADILLSWMGDRYATYTVQRKLDLVSGSWSNVMENISGIDAVMTVTNNITEPQAFFRTIAE